jgi:hypothetical protein
MRWSALAAVVGMSLASSAARADTPELEQRTFKATQQTPSGARSLEAVASISRERITLHGYDPARKQWATLIIPLFDELTVEGDTFTFLFPGPPGKPRVTLRLTQAQLDGRLVIKGAGACDAKAGLRLTKRAPLRIDCPSLMDHSEDNEGYEKYLRKVRKRPGCWFLQDPLPAGTCTLFSSERYYASPHRQDRLPYLESYLGYELPLDELEVRLRYCSKADDPRCLDVHPLKEAFESGHPELVPVLLREGADPKEPGLLRAAITGGHEEAFQALLAAGAPIQEHDLQLATLHESPKWMELLLKAGARPGPAYLMDAVNRGREDLARKLLAINPPGDWTGLMNEAVRRDMKGLVEDLLARGAQLPAPRDGG